ncbi:hypothetical protein THO17_24770 [Marinomonas sp. THO17]
MFGETKAISGLRRGKLKPVKLINLRPKVLFSDTLMAGSTHEPNKSSQSNAKAFAQTKADYL